MISRQKWNNQGGVESGNVLSESAFENLDFRYAENEETLLEKTCANLAKPRSLMFFPVLIKGLRNISY